MSLLLYLLGIALCALYISEKDDVTLTPNMFLCAIWPIYMAFVIILGTYDTYKDYFKNKNY